MTLEFNIYFLMRDNIANKFSNHRYYFVACGCLDMVKYKIKRSQTVI